MPCHKRPPVPVHLSLPDKPPTQAEIDAILMATDSIIGDAGRAGVTLILINHTLESWGERPLPHPTL